MNYKQITITVHLDELPGSGAEHVERYLKEHVTNYNYFGSVSFIVNDLAKTITITYDTFEEK